MIDLDYKIFESSPTFRYMVDFDLKHLRGSNRILDLGCGNGDDMLRHDFRCVVIGVDIERDRCKEAKKKLRMKLYALMLKSSPSFLTHLME